MFDKNLLLGDVTNLLRDGDGEIETIGMLELYDSCVKYTINHVAIYANGNLFCSTYNDPETAKAVFVKTMQAAFGGNFKCQ